MPAPESYNSAHLSIAVDPLILWRYATVDLNDHATVVVEAIGRIQSIWQGLKLGWAGQTAGEAEDFANLWAAAITGLFGTESSPESGAIARLQQSAAMAALNYAVAEDTTWRMFRESNFASDGGYAESGTNLDPWGHPHYNTDGSPTSSPSPDGSPAYSPDGTPVYPGAPFTPPSNEAAPPWRDDDGGPDGGPIQVHTPPG